MLRRMRNAASRANDAKPGQTFDAASRARDFGHLAAVIRRRAAAPATRDGNTGAVEAWTHG